ncbi:PilZ domain-containing protein [Diplocloster agilis]|uniref:PilZ domain-containing protein n=1 Tax=Diplocloster agilis TaxID=2850323 RepID=UPI000821FFF6|nr:PilZ domain-containing protein [Suonthocola fibrivorans]MCU6734555.1 PilZ domain-containing protein [Suonthocola fibrivorans]SCJ44465.1 Predicted glycosyltransferase [uncultured Clostridium sp.]
MVELPDSYVGSSCVVKTKNNDLLTMGTLHRVKEKYIDISSSRNELPEIPYNLLVKVEIYNTRIGFRVLIGRVYISTKQMARITDLNEATNDERREYFRISTRDEGIIYNLVRKAEEDEAQNEDANDIRVQLVDISLGGLMFKIKRELTPDDSFNIMIPKLGDSMLYACEIRRRVERADGYLGYGCEFMEMTVLQEDLLYKYILKRQNDQLRRIR